LPQADLAQARKRAKPGEADFFVYRRDKKNELLTGFRRA
jgi:hypothetical protein